MLLAFACVDRHYFVWQTCLLEKERDFQWVRRRVVVKADHLGSPFVVYERTDGFRSRGDFRVSVRRSPPGKSRLRGEVARIAPPARCAPSYWRPDSAKSIGE